MEGSSDNAWVDFRRDEGDIMYSRGRGRSVEQSKGKKKDGKKDQSKPRERSRPKYKRSRTGVRQKRRRPLDTGTMVLFVSSALQLASMGMKKREDQETHLDEMPVTMKTYESDGIMYKEVDDPILGKITIPVKQQTGER